VGEKGQEITQYVYLRKWIGQICFYYCSSRSFVFKLSTQFLGQAVSLKVSNLRIHIKGVGIIPHFPSSSHCFLLLLL